MLFDPLNGADVSPLPSADWTAVSNPLQIANAECIGTAIAGDNEALSTAGTATDLEIEFRVAALAPDGESSVALFARAASDLSTCYTMGLVRNADGTAKIQLVGETDLLTIARQPFNVGDTFGMKVKGSALTVFQNGGVIGQVTDAGISGPGGFGFGIYPNSSLTDAAVVDFIQRTL